MSTDGGITRRRKVHNADNSGTSGNSLPTSQSVCSSDMNDKELFDTEDADSKETRLTLMEEVLLLGIKDKEVLLKHLFFNTKH